jgi:putative phosphoesterase
MAIGVISDTHGLLRDEAIDALSSVDLIIHAGDVGKADILERLREIAPVVAVRGNIDREAWASALPRTAVAQVASRRIYVLHDIHELDIDPAAAGFQMVISGHSHKPSRVEKNGVTYFNPGSAGPRRFSLPISVARLHVAGEVWNIEFITLPDRTQSGKAGSGRGLHGGRS